MRTIIKTVLLYAFSLYITQLVFDGLTLRNNWETYIISGLLLAIGFKILKPILSVIALPFNLLSFGLFGIVIIAFILFVITLLYPAIEVSSFMFPGFSLGGIQIHSFYVSLILSYVIISATIYLITKAINWLFE